jgi:hypothetical protein
MSATRMYIVAALAAFAIIMGSWGLAAEREATSVGNAVTCEDVWGACRRACAEKYRKGGVVYAICKNRCDEALTECNKKRGVLQRGTSGSKLSEAGTATSETPKRRLPTGTEPAVERSPKPAASPLRRVPQLKDAAAVTAEPSVAPKPKPTPKPSPRK